MEQAEHFAVRIALLQDWLDEHAYDGVLLNRADNFGMATGGRRNYVWTHSDLGANALYVPRTGKPLYVGNTIEWPRQRDEELHGLDLDALTYDWFERTPAAAVRERFSGHLVSDDGSLGANVHGALAPLRAALTPVECARYRALGTLAAEAMEQTLRSVWAGDTEAGIAARLKAAGAARNCEVPVALVAADGRIARYRHPLPTVAPLAAPGRGEATVERYVMVVGCFLREGLVVSLTRFAQVGEWPAGIEDAMRRIAVVDATFQAATQPGHTLGEVFARGQQAYAENGFAEDEWRNHHQGGATGYAGRTCKGAPGEAFPVLQRARAERLAERLGRAVPLSAAFAWNPSAPGVKSEDTFLLHADGSQEILTRTPALPAWDLSGFSLPADLTRSRAWVAKKL